MPVSAELPAAADLRPEFEQWGLLPRSQGSRPTCSVFTIAGALEFAVARRQNRGERLSVEFLNWAANQTRRGNRDGGFFSDMWRGFEAHGICTEPQMPYQPEYDATIKPEAEVLGAAKARLALELKLHWIKRWNVSTSLSDEEFFTIKRRLHQGWPVCSGLRWPQREVWQNDVLQMCPPEEVFDGHSVLLVGYRDDPAQAGGGVFIFRNTNRGGRDGFMPYDYARAYMNDAVWIESTPAAEAASRLTAPADSARHGP
ncbi:MAG: C1 family peptidase [Verrucomicrobiae bacterium]|nr:C1 family peptidase [Verrucomicrobiae bacterium]